ncbi:MAG: cupredoxin family copper-binding protein [Dehalococcoidales bacterium]
MIGRKNVNYPPALIGLIIAGFVLLVACGPSVPKTEGLSETPLPDTGEHSEEDSGDGNEIRSDNGETDGLPLDNGHDDEPLASPDIEMEIAGFAFGEKTIVVPVGTSITWQNGDSVSHTVTTVETMFHSGLLSHDETFTYTFDEPGVFDYFCTIHPYMRATIIVE